MINELLRCCFLLSCSVIRTGTKMRLFHGIYHSRIIISLNGNRERSRRDNLLSTVTFVLYVDHFKPIKIIIASTNQIIGVAQHFVQFPMMQQDEN